MRSRPNRISNAWTCGVNLNSDLRKKHDGYKQKGLKMLGYLIIFFVGIPLFALSFSVTCVVLGFFSEDFKPNGPGGFLQLYKQFLIIAAIYVGLAFVGIRGILGLGIIALGYKYVFHATWKHALIIGFFGGIAGWIAMVALLLVLNQMGLAIR